MTRSPWATWLIAALLIAFTHPPAHATPASEWRTVSNKDGVLVEHRRHEGSRLYEVRATVDSSLLPAAIFDTIWLQQEHPQFVPHLKRLDILSEAGDERLTYEQVAVPLAVDRDYTVRLQKRVDTGAQRYEITFATANDAGPPPDKHHVRVPSIRGRWLIEPGPGGQGSRVGYEVFSDPGGVLPTWLVNRAQGATVAKVLRAMLERTRERARRLGG